MRSPRLRSAPESLHFQADSGREQNSLPALVGLRDGRPASCWLEAALSSQKATTARGCPQFAKGSLSTPTHELPQCGYRLHQARKESWRVKYSNKMQSHVTTSPWDCHPITSATLRWFETSTDPAHTQTEGILQGPGHQETE